MEDANLKNSQIDGIVLVSGITGIPKVQEPVRDYFDGKESDKGVNPDEVAEFGAAVQGDILSRESGEDTKYIRIFCVAHHTLGIETVGGVMTKVIPRFTATPTKKSLVFTTYQDQQSSVSIKVYQGEKRLTKNCRLLGTFNLTGIPPAPRGTPQIEVTFKVDHDENLYVKAEDKASGQSKNITITKKIYPLTQEEIECMAKEAEEFAEEEKKMNERIYARNALEDYIYNMKSQINDKDKLADKLKEEEKEKIEITIKEALEWMEDYQSAEQEDYDEKLKEVKAVSNPIIMAQMSGGAPGGGSESTEDYEDHDDL